MNDPIELKIVDLGEAASLVINGFRIIRLDSSKNKRGEPMKIFIFESKNGMTEIIEKYVNQTLSVDAYSFYRTTRDLKSRIHDHNVMHNQV